MNWLDWIILVIVVMSTLISVWRGFVKEALSLAAWVAAFLISTSFAARLSLKMTDFITNDAFRYAAAYVILFASTLILGAIVNKMLAGAIKATGLTGTDRALGTVFGFARGLVLVLVMVFVLRALLNADEQDFMRDSRLLPHLAMVEQWARETFSDVTVNGQLPWVGRSGG
jgi:membrane protein required for colicin V production